MALKLFFKIQLYVLLIILVLTLLTLLAGALFAWSKFSQFANAAGLPKSEIKQILEQGWAQTPESQAGQKNFLILGLDTLETRGDVPPLTDTIILASADLETGQIKTLSLPRDLWNDQYITRINALYFYGLEKYPDEPERFIKEVLEELTGLKIHHTLVLSFGQVSELIDLLGGIEVDVPIGFVDDQFPRSDVDVTVVRDPALLYKTIEFKPGKQVMSGKIALEYMRSRKSGDDEGTDIARGARQQLVIEALASKLRQRSTLTDPILLGQIYRFYDDNFAGVISLQEILATAKKLYPVRDSLSFVGSSLSIFPDDPDGVIWHPPLSQYKGEWVYAILDLQLFREEVIKKLN